MDQTFMKTRAPLSLVLAMSLPMVISMLVNSLYNIIDSYFVARISDDAMTALSLVYPVQNLVNAVSIGFGIGINAAIAQDLGAGERERADDGATWGLVLAGLHGFLLMIACLALIPSFLRSFTADETVISYALRYSRIVFAFSVVVSLAISFEKVYQAAGKMTVSMVSMLCGCVLNIILDPVLIFGAGRIPAMGIEGAALATGIGQTASLVIYVAIYMGGSLPVRLRLRGRGKISEKKHLGRLYYVGIPAALNIALPSVLIAALNGILSQFSQMYVLILGIYYKLQTFIYLTANGIVQGVRPLVGYNYGAMEFGRVKKIHYTALMLCSAVMLGGMTVCLVVPGRLIGLFTSNPETVRAGSAALQTICWGFVASSVSVMTSGTLEGLGKGLPSLVISLIRYIALIPIAYVLSRMAGVSGVWNAFWITELAAAAASCLLYRLNV